jgi:hypothetical protein
MMCLERRGTKARPSQEHAPLAEKWYDIQFYEVGTGIGRIREIDVM